MTFKDFSKNLLTAAEGSVFVFFLCFVAGSCLASFVTFCVLNFPVIAVPMVLVIVLTRLLYAGFNGK